MNEAIRTRLDLILNASTSVVVTDLADALYGVLELADHWRSQTGGSADQRAWAENAAVNLEFIVAERLEIAL